MKRIIYILTLVVLGTVLVGCYGNYKNPRPEKIWEDADLIEEGYNIVTIAELKQLYFNQYPVDHAANKVLITRNYVIKGKVITNDRPGNFYRNMIIQDASGALEIKVGKGSLQNEYKVGQTVYVVAENLTLGNYRFMLSLGTASANPQYSNDYIDLQQDIDHHIRKGAMTTLTDADILEIKGPGDLNDPADLGRLVKFKGVRSVYGTNASTNNRYPKFTQTYILNGVTGYAPDFEDVIAAWRNYYNGTAAKPQDNPPSQYYAYPNIPQDRLYPTWGYHDVLTNSSFYGEALFVFGTSSTNDVKANYVVRTSGYSKFANDKLPENGAVVDLTAILGKFSSSNGGFITYQLTLNNSTDVVPAE